MKKLTFGVHWLALGAMVDNLKSFERGIKLAAKNGARTIELPWKPLMKLPAESVAGVLQRAKIKRVALCCFNGKEGLNPLVDRKSGKNLLKSLDQAKGYLEEIRIWSNVEPVGITGPWLYQIGAEYDLLSISLHVRSSTLAGAVGDLFGEFGMIAALETLRKEEDGYFVSPLQAVAFVDTIGNPALKVHLDTFHLEHRNCAPGAVIGQSGHHIGWLHASGARRYTPGHQGDRINWEYVALGIKEAQKKGMKIKDIVFEGFSPEFRKLVPEIGGEFPEDLSPEESIPLAQKTLRSAGIC